VRTAARLILREAMMAPAGWILPEAMMAPEA
jgi:hypothetical protein